jgi:serine protease DegQ
VGDTNQMLTLISSLPPGQKAQLTVIRKNQQSTLDVTVGKRPRPQPTPDDE